jgi:hypothetical protein
MTTQTTTPASITLNEKTVTFRSNNGKAHRGFMVGSFLMACCSCPGSQNGKLTKFAKIICDGHEKANCGN